MILNGDTGDIACDSYHKYQEDIQLLKQLKVCQNVHSVAVSEIPKWQTLCVSFANNYVH